MSDMSWPHCGQCRSPAYACQCEDGPTEDPREERLRAEAKRRGADDISLWLVLADLRNLYGREASDAEIDDWIARVEAAK